MHTDADAERRHVEEAAGLDDFESFVQQSCRIDGDAPAHHPGGMLERLLDGDVLELAAGVGCGRVRLKR